MRQNIVFISDLHLDSHCKNITKKWNEFFTFALENIQELYILGDFFAVWAGDDLINNFQLKIAKQIKNLISKGIKVNFLPGNRDFLLGKKFSQLSGWRILPEQTVIELNGLRVLLLHGDELCTQDLSHQRFRKISRNKIIQKIFLLLPKQTRINIATKIRKSSLNKQLTPSQMEVSNQMIRNLFQKNKADIMIHGHIHKPCIENLILKYQKKTRYVLSDWDDIPKILVYNVSTNNFVLREYNGI